ncbi:hypothetical protein QBC40DRAFT_271202 [Triangularia verruculosa]|uniref:DUF1772-domain-containing protein n=1 Tax=Triangularia verruculosa TaxID=2587418 RepID=A0AAN6XQV1_9PEZI|nr:hypothetical protein QBC40DRAFT_271202 [Triangularia verruculosa]
MPRFQRLDLLVYTFQFQHLILSQQPQLTPSIFHNYFQPAEYLITMSLSKPSLPVIKTSTLLLTAFTTGLSLTYSTVVTPLLLTSPTPLMLQQWKKMFLAGSTHMPPLSIISAVSFFYLAAKSPAHRNLWSTAGGLTLGIIPYTLALMMGTNNELLKREGELTARAKTSGAVVVSESEEKGAKELVDRWGVLNLGRTAMLLGAVGLGAWTSLL